MMRAGAPSVRQVGDITRLTATTLETLNGVDPIILQNLLEHFGDAVKRLASARQFFREGVVRRWFG